MLCFGRWRLLSETALGRRGTSAVSATDGEPRVPGGRSRREGVHRGDPAWDVPGVLDQTAAADGMKLNGAFATHHHPDQRRRRVVRLRRGPPDPLERQARPVHAHRLEADGLAVTGISKTDMTLHDPARRSASVRSRSSGCTRLGHTPGLGHASAKDADRRRHAVSAGLRARGPAGRRPRGRCAAR